MKTLIEEMDDLPRIMAGDKLYNLDGSLCIQISSVSENKVEWKALTPFGPRDVFFRFPTKEETNQMPCVANKHIGICRL